VRKENGRKKKRGREKRREERVWGKREREREREGEKREYRVTRGVRECAARRRRKRERESLSTSLFSLLPLKEGENGSGGAFIS